MLTAETAYNTDLDQPVRESLLCSAFLSYVLFSPLCSFVMARILHWAARLEPTASDIIMHEWAHHTHTCGHTQTHIQKHVKRNTVSSSVPWTIASSRDTKKKEREKGAKKINGQAGVMSHSKGQPTAVCIISIWCNTRTREFIPDNF